LGADVFSGLGYWAFVIGVSVPVGAIIRVLWQQFLGDKKEWVEDLFVVVTLTVVFGPMLVLLNLGMILHTELSELVESYVRPPKIWLLVKRLNGVIGCLTGLMPLKVYVLPK